MRVDVQPGTYIVAVSGGVDSVVLLDVLVRQPNLQLVVAHYDHGIRSDSEKDRIFVSGLCQTYNIPFEHEEGNLGTGASEEKARSARYSFLRKVCKKHMAEAVITAHHQDDVLETLVLHMMRGTGRSGLSSLKSGNGVVRPLLSVPKSELYKYAKKRHLVWREDPTNTDQTYTRNWIRHTIIPKMTDSQRKQLVQLHDRTSKTNMSIDQLLEVLTLPFIHANTMQRRPFIALPHDVAKEVLAGWLRQNGIRDFDRSLIERLSVALKTRQTGKIIDVKKHFYIQIHAKNFVIKTRE